MKQPHYKIVNNTMGWMVFAISALVYCCTVEPTASLWDCSEFIISAYKLEIGHPPGAPFFMLTANLFSQFASDPSQVALMVNIMSALMSAACVMFLFWTVAHLMRRLLCGYAPVQSWYHLIIIEGSALVGAMACMFSDSFWYSAVEAEVYSYSIFLTALVFWLMLKWEEEADTPHSTRWIMLISYLIGLSMGVHLLNLLCIPAMVLVYYFRRHRNVSAWGIAKALMVSFAILGGILYVLVPGILWMAGRAELLAVNVCGMPFNSGALCFLLLLAALITLGIVRLKGLKRTVLTSITFILVGFSCYSVIIIRSLANPPMDENSPEEVFSLRRYISREQYGDTPLFYGPTYKTKPKYVRRGNMMVAECKEGATLYAKSEEEGRYIDTGKSKEYVYEDNMLFPRMHSGRHAKAYEQWLGGVKGPTMAENLRFFFTYQLNFMYIRYFLWNFVGRQNDIPGNGELEYGNWITGIDLIDGWLLGCDMSKLPSDLRENKGRNVYYALPLLLGVLGILWQSRRKEYGVAQCHVVAWLFFMTGIAIVLYVNQSPLQARERDYSYAGSFYAFCIWVGMGTGAVVSLLRRCRMGKISSAIVGVLLCLIVPLQMGCQTWDDHDRSGRYACRDFGNNYLESACKVGKPIIFCCGDNDTFPLWYNQEVEGRCTDARVCNLSYADVDWYVDQMLRPAYDSPALPLGWGKKDYSYGVNDAVYVEAELKEGILSLYRQEPETMERVFGEQPFELGNILKHWVFNKTEGMSEEDVRLRKYVKALLCGREDEWQTLDIRCFPMDEAYVTQPSGKRMPLSFKGMKFLTKKDLLLLQLLTNADEERPLYLATSVNVDDVPYLEPHLVCEGMLYRIVSSDSTDVDMRIDAERLYENIMHRFTFGGLSAEGVYADYDVRKMTYALHHKMALLIDALMKQGDYTRALKVVRKWQQELPQSVALWDESTLPMLICLYETGNVAEADEIVSGLLDRTLQWQAWMASVRPDGRKVSGFTQYRWNQMLERCFALLYKYNRNDLIERFASRYDAMFAQ